MRSIFMLAAVVSGLLLAPANAQDGVARYSGAWQATVGDGGTGMCRIELRPSGSMYGLSATTLGCLGPLAMVNNWTANGGNVHLLGFMGETIATFSPGAGGLDGRFADGAPVTLMPRGGQAVAAPVQQSCIVRPDTGLCAASGEIAVPQSFPVSVRSFTRLAIRTEPSQSAAMLGEIAAGQCFTIDACYETQDGIRCHLVGAPGTVDGYVAKHFVGNGVTQVGFQNFC